MPFVWSAVGKAFHVEGRWKEAEVLDVAVMEIAKIVFGDEHEETLTSISYLVSMFWSQGRLKEAEELDVQEDAWGRASDYYLHGQPCF
ncbi:hypothetical protein BKA66DRAFT_452993 [Pyrenochaeta sp. MPI-SDFR-AT-0127]|nr:hypothetical protein BKA66DRAFT_452993 [Pyrenochaeta sp. MPI-SDFR-AT-0127]